MALRVLHLVGSAVSEFLSDLSRLYAEDCLAATADPDRYEFHIAYVSPDLSWRFPVDLSPQALETAPRFTVAEAMGRLSSLDLDVVVPQMFCLPGMTSYRALFDVLGVPYVGNTPDVMALGAHKARARAVVAAAGVPVPAGELLRHGDQPTLAPPVVVKPVDGDNSLGVTLVRERGDYDAAIAAAFVESDEVLVESFVELGREVRCGVLERDGELICLPLEEYSVHPDTKPIRDHADKIRSSDRGALSLVAKDSSRAWIVATADPLTRRVWDLARLCHRALGCRHYSLFDFRVDPDGQPWFLEAGLYCSFARSSVVSMMARAAGISVPDLFADVVAEALTHGSPGSQASPAAQGAKSNPVTVNGLVV